MCKLGNRFAALLGLAFVLFLFESPVRAQRIIHPVDRIASIIDDRFTEARAADRHPLARQQYDNGRVAPDMRMARMILVLQSDAQQQKALDELLTNQLDPQSAEYHHWLTPESFGAQFGVSENDITQIVNWLEGHGFELEPVSPDHRTIVFSGSAAQVASAFHTEIHTYIVKGRRHYANAGAPAIPEALSTIVQGVVSLHDFALAPMHGALTPILTPLPMYSSNSTTHYIAPGDFATIYNAAQLYTSSIDGTGQSIAVIGRTNINISDVTSFRSRMGLPVNNPAVILNGTDPGIVSSGEETEAVLDVEWSGAVAPKAAIKFVVSPSTTTDGVALSAQFIVANNVAPVVSFSFGSCEAGNGASGNQFWNGLWQQAAAQGMTVLVAAGDSGAAGCDGGSETTAGYTHNINALCSPPYSTCVGGTQFADTANPGIYWSSATSPTWTSALSYIPEAAWNESGVAGGSGLWAGGGGPSMIYSKPSWQNGPGVPADGWRDVPDVSLTAAGHDGYIICMNGGFYVVGGTSAAAPSFAGLMALTAQKTGGRLGNANPTFYALAAKQASGGAAFFHDVAAGNNSVPGLAGYTAGVGYDMATGLGSVDAAMLVNHWADGSVSSPTFQLSATPTTLSFKQGGSATTSVTITSKAGFNSAITLSAAGLPAGVTASFAPATLTGAIPSTLTLNSTAQAAAATSNVTIQASGGGVTQSVGLAVTITGCSYSISPASASPAATGGNYTGQVATGAGCTWTASSGVSWIALTSGVSGSGNGTVNYSVAVNSATSSRSGAISIAGLSLGVTQAAAAPPFSISSTSASVGASASAESVSVTAAPAAAAWTAVSNVNWIAVTSGASSTGSKTVTYAVAANTATAARVGTMTIAQLTFTVNQAGATCSYSINPSSATPGAAAGAYTVQVTASEGCSWSGASNASWLGVTAGASGKGSGTVNYSVTANTATTARAGSIAIAGATFGVTQAAAAPAFSLNPTSASVTSDAAPGSVAVTSSSTTALWTASSGASWIAIASGASYTGSKSVVYAVAKNTAASSRTGTLSIAGLTYTLNQGGLACSYVMNPTSANPGSGAATYTAQIAVASGCSWTSVSSASWMTVNGGSSGSGNGIITYTVAANTAATPRNGAITSGGAILSVLQAGNVAPFTLSPGSATYTSLATSGTVVVTASSPAASWTAASNANWIAVSSGASSVGSKNVGYTVAGNSTGGTRTGTITVAGLPFTIVQAGGSACNFSISPGSASVTAAGGQFGVQVTAGAGCPWTAASNSWTLNIVSGASGNGNGAVTYAAAPNTDAARSGTLTIAGINFGVNQGAAPTGTIVFALSATSANVPATAASGSVGVSTTSQGTMWTAVSNAAWITVTGGASGSGARNVTYSVTANPDLTARVGTITIAGLIYTVAQGGVGCTYTIGAASVVSGTAGFLLSFPVATAEGCSWTATSNASWLTVVSGSPGNGNGTAVYNVPINGTRATRTASVTVAGQTMTISQGGN